MTQGRHTGFGLVEVLVALAIGLLILGSATTGFALMRKAQRGFDSHARLQEAALQALATIETDLRMAGFHGLANQLPTIDASLTFPAKCGGATWVTDVERPVDGANGIGFGRPDCAGAGGGVLPGSDVLIVRRASARPTALSGGKVETSMRERVLVVARLDAATLFVADATDGSLPDGYDAAADPEHPVEVREWLVDAYYVSRDSSAGRAIPALRRKTLRSGPDIGDEELVTGVEDLQVVIGADLDGDGTVDADFAPGAVPEGARAVFARIWILLRAPERDDGYGGSPAMAYADRAWPAANDGHARRLLSKTVHLRNR
jgi:type IV pilus assembly protein PilW